jgi:phage replication-related protein YjqB (UPF0714/DUF867 family)
MRVTRPTADKSIVALYTVIRTHDEEIAEKVFLGYQTTSDLERRLGLTDIEEFAGEIDAKVTSDLSEEDARGENEFIERLFDDGQHCGLIAIAPHGGEIEKSTDKQAELVGRRLSSKGVSVWVCKGFGQNNDAFDRWHITSTHINPESFPQLRTIIGRQFEYAVAFHGWLEDSICIGGSMPDEIKLQIKTAIENVVGPIIPVTLSSECPHNFNGNDPVNIVNRLARKSLQIEQCERARRDFHDRIAEAVADVLDPLINEGGFSGPNNSTVAEQDLRNAIVAGALAERQSWTNGTGGLLQEDDDSQFGFLVKYWLASKRLVRPTTLVVMQAKAINPVTAYGDLLDPNATDQDVTDEAEEVSAELIAGAPDSSSPANLCAFVADCLISSRYSRFDDDNKGRWSAAFILSVVRTAAISLGLETMIGNLHSGRDGFLIGTSAHRVYLLEAYDRRFGVNRMVGTYQAFRLNERMPQVGDIIIQDRPANDLTEVLDFDEIPTTQGLGYNLHGDLIVEVPDDADYVITIGGNVGDGVRRRRYPLDSNRHLVVEKTQLFTQESSTGVLPALPDIDSSEKLHARSTGRIFALLSLVRQCC